MNLHLIISNFLYAFGITNLGASLIFAFFIVYKLLSYDPGPGIATLKLDNILLALNTLINFEFYLRESNLGLRFQNRRVVRVVTSRPWAYFIRIFTLEDVFVHFNLTS